MKRLVLIGAVLVLVVLIGVAVVLIRSTGGSTATDEGPAARTEKFERSLIAGDCLAFRKLVVDPGQVNCAELAEMSESVKDIDPDAIVYKVVDSGAGTATVELTIEGEKQRLDLVNESGDWLVIFDTAA